MVNQNEIIEFLCDQSVDKTKLLYELLKHEEEKKIVNESGKEIKPKKSCKDCKWGVKDQNGSSLCAMTQPQTMYMCMATDYKYWEKL